MRSPFRLVVLFGLIDGAAVGHAQTPARAIPAASVAALRKCVLDYRADQAKYPGLAEYHCFESENGWFLALDSVWAREAIPKVREAVERFEKAFGGKPVPRGLFKQVPPKGAPRPRNVGLPPSFKAAGAQWDWPWNTDQSDGFHLHEMAHRWIGWVYTWTVRDSSLVGRTKYGSPAHDWLDESAAIFASGSASVDDGERFRDSLKSHYRAGKILPLDRLLTERHPMAGSSGLSGPAGGPGALSLSESGLFYGQCRVFMDFLLEQTKDSAVLGALAANEAAGRTVAEWLPANAARYKLPTTMTGLEAAWQTWLKEWAARSESATP